MPVVLKRLAVVFDVFIFGIVCLLLFLSRLFVDKKLFGCWSWHFFNRWSRYDWY